MGLVVEKANSIYRKSDLTDKEIERNILIYPYKRFEDMNILRHSKSIGIIEVDSAVWKRLSNEDKSYILGVSDNKLREYFEKIT